MNRLGSAVVLALVTVVTSPLAQVAHAQDPVQVAPEVYKVVFENPRVRVMEVTMAPGAKAAVHSHPDHFAYGLTGGKVKFTHADGSSVEAEIKAGEVVWVPAGKHMSENVGEGEVKVMVVELKEPAAKPAKAPKAATKKG